MTVVLARVCVACFAARLSVEWRTMIYDHLSRISLYRPLSKHIARAIDFVQTAPLETLPAGRHEVDGEAVFATIYETHTLEGGAKWESHRRYIDLQLMLRGREQQKVADINILADATPYDTAKDVVFYRSAPQALTAELSESQFVFYFPHDGHLPMIAVGSDTAIRKLVVKIAVE